MTETRSPSRNQTAALVGLLTVVILVLISPIGTQLVLPYLGDTIATVWLTFWSTVTDGASWVWNDALVPVLNWWAA